MANTPTIAAGPGVAAPAKPKRAPLVTRATLNTIAKNLAKNLIPPVVVLIAFLVIWEMLCSRPGAGLPPPSRVVTEAWDIIAHPFYDNGGTDKGLFWHIAASIQRVALGFALATVVGILTGTLIGQSEWAMRGLDPIFQVLRTIPPLAWLPLSLAAFRDGQPSAIFVIFITSIWPIIINTAVGIRNIPQDYRNVSAVLRLNPLEFFAKIMLPLLGFVERAATGGQRLCPPGRQLNCLPSPATSSSSAVSSPPAPAPQVITDRREAIDAD